MFKLNIDAELQNRIVGKIKKMVFNLKKNVATGFCPALDKQKQYVVTFFIEKIHDCHKTVSVNSASSPVLLHHN